MFQKLIILIWIEVAFCHTVNYQVKLKIIYLMTIIIAHNCKAFKKRLKVWFISNKEKDDKIINSVLFNKRIID